MVTRKKALFFQKPKFREGVFIFSLVIIPLIHLAVFWVYVNIGTVLTTFQRWDVLTGGMKWVGLDRYKTMFNEYFLGYTNGHTALANIFWNSFRAILINAIIFPIALVASYAFYKKIPHEKFFRICFYLPSLISITVLTTVYRSLFNADFGPITLFAKAITGTNPKFLANDSDSMWTLIYVFCIWVGLGSNVIMMT